MDLQILRFFVASADTGSFSAAAEKLHYAQSNLSTRIAQLEKELETTLFYRYKKGIALTAKGNVFYNYAVRILSLSEEAILAMKDSETARGKLMIGSIEATALRYLPSLLSEYHRKCPDVALSMQTDLNDFLPEKVLNRSIDGAFVTGPVSHPVLEEVPFRIDHLIFVGSAQYNKRQPEDLLRNAPLITFTEGSSFRRRLELLLSSKGIPYADRLTTLNSLGAMIAGISAGIGCGYLPRSVVAPYIESGLMAEYPVDDTFSELDVIFVFRRDHIRDTAFRKFLEMLESVPVRPVRSSSSTPEVR